MSKVIPGFFVSVSLLLLCGVFFASCVKSYNRRMDRAWTIHDCVMEKWIERETATGIMPTQWEELQWRRQCSQEWSAMPTKPS
jgi:hypothetical protein